MNYVKFCNSPVLPDDGLDLPELQRQLTRDLIEQALARTGGVKAQACRLLGINRTTLVEKMRSLGMKLNPPSCDCAY